MDQAHPRALEKGYGLIPRSAEPTTGRLVTDLLLR